MISGNISTIVLLCGGIVFALITVRAKMGKNVFLTLASTLFALSFVDAAVFFLYEWRVPDETELIVEETAEVEPPAEPGEALVLGPKKYRITGDLSDPDPILGYAPVPGSVVHESMYCGTVPVYENVKYEIDGKRRRKSSTPNGNPPRHAIFFGGSYAFGDGLETDETLASQFQAQSAGEYQSFNYGFKGWGAGQMLCRLGMVEEFDDIPQRSGVGIYVFIDDHVQRTTGKPRYLASSPTYPLFALSDSGELEGPFHYADRAGYRLIMDAYTTGRSASPLLRKVVGPDSIDFVAAEDGVRVVAAVVIAAKTKYESMFDGEFHVLVWPRRRLRPELEEKFVDEISEAGVSVLRVPAMDNELSAVIGVHEGKVIDGHPSALETEWVASHLHGLLGPTAEAGELQRSH